MTQYWIGNLPGNTKKCFIRLRSQWSPGAVCSCIRHLRPFSLYQSLKDKWGWGYNAARGLISRDIAIKFWRFVGIKHKKTQVKRNIFRRNVISFLKILNFFPQKIFFQRNKKEISKCLMHILLFFFRFLSSYLDFTEDGKSVKLTLLYGKYYIAFCGLYNALALLKYE